MWTRFMDMRSGGPQKLEWSLICIEAPYDEAKAVFYARFRRNPERFTCTCCGEDYSIRESPTLQEATAYERGCRTLESRRDEKGLYLPMPEGKTCYLEPDEAPPKGWTVRRLSSLRSGRGITLDEYLRDPNILVIYARDIAPSERSLSVPEEGYVWTG
jgi:hypothetical protein